MDLKGAGKVMIRDSKLVGRAGRLTGLPDSPTLPPRMRRQFGPGTGLTLVDTISAIELGCSEAESSVVQIINSEIDITDTMGITGPAVYVDANNCQGRLPELLVSGTTFKLEEASNQQGSSGSGPAFDFRHLAGNTLRFQSGSACNRVVSASSEMDISDDHRLHVARLPFDIGAGQISGVFGLSNGKGWGLLPTEEGMDESMADLRPWCFWEQQLQNVMVACPGSSVVPESCTSTTLSAVQMPTVAPNITGAPQGSTTLSTPMAEAQKANAATSGGAVTGYAVAGVVGALLLQQVITQPIYYKATAASWHTLAKFVNFVGFDGPKILQGVILPGIVSLYLGVHKKTDDPVELDTVSTNTQDTEVRD